MVEVFPHEKVTPFLTYGTQSISYQCCKQMGFDHIMDIPMKHLNKSAIILVGSTGTGKSSTIKKCTGQDVIVGDGHQSVTKCCEVY